MNASPAGTYRTLFLLLLEQRTAFSPGGTAGNLAWTDMPIDRDGQGRPYLRGSGVAGALMSTARTFLQVPDDVCRAWSDDASGTAEPDDNPAQPGSLIQPWSGYRWKGSIDDGGIVDAALTPDARIGTPHSQATRTSTNLFDYETIPRGTRWLLPLEVKALLPAGKTPSDNPTRYAALALREWARDRLWMGRRVSRGLGWMHLKECQVWHLPATEAVVDAWPDSNLSDLAGVRNALKTSVKALDGVTHFASLDAFVAKTGLDGSFGDPHWLGFPEKAYLHWPVEVTAGEYKPFQGGASDLSYGLDPLAISGHGTSCPDADDFGGERLARPEQWQWDKYKADFPRNDTPALAMDSVVDGQGNTHRQLGLPASGVAGAWRAWWSARERHDGNPVLDPNQQETYAARRDADNIHFTESASADAERPRDSVSHRFGYVKQPRAGSQPEARASALLIADGLFEVDKPWCAALLEKLAIDEFSQAAQESAKFRRLAVLVGSWTMDVVLEIDCHTLDSDGNTPDTEARLLERMKQEVAAMNGLFDNGRKRRIAFGGGQSVSYGSVKFDLASLGRWALAGRDWQKLPAKVDAWSRLTDEPAGSRFAEPEAVAKAPDKAKAKPSTGSSRRRR